ncbi:MAG: ribonuclease Z [Rikenellaceae bacterium]|nr:ribonuclease Z [Rikenellaceae bacterium]
MTFSVTILGSGSAAPAANRHHTAHALNVHEQFYLIDCGEGTQERMRRYGISPMKLKAIFISHLHGDHIFGLPGILSTLNHLGRKTPLPIFGPPPIEEYLDFHHRHFTQYMGYEILCQQVNARENTLIYQNNVLEVTTLPLRHRIPSCGYLFREKTPGWNVDKQAIEKYGLSRAQIVALKRGESVRLTDGTLLESPQVTYIPYQGRSYAYCSDTLYSGKVVRLVHGVDLLYHEATFLDKDKQLAKETGHTTARQAARAALLSESHRLMIGHFSSRYKDENLFLEEACSIFPRTILAREGEMVSIP